MSTVKSVRKRDGRVVPFDQGKITNAIYKALFAVEGSDGTPPRPSATGSSRSSTGSTPEATPTSRPFRT